MYKHVHIALKTLGGKVSLGAAPKLLNIPKNWLHQGLSYMDRTEFFVRVFVEIAEMLFMVNILSYVLQVNILNWLLIVMSFMIVHTVNWMLNGNWWALAMFTFPGLRNAGEKATCKYLSRMADRLRASRAIAALAIYGSVARGKWHDKSDLDIRILRNKGLLNGLAAAAITMRERAIAFFSGQPIDLFLADSAEFLGRMSVDEKPVILLKRGAYAAHALQGEEEVLVDFRPAR